MPYAPAPVILAALLLGLPQEARTPDQLLKDLGNEDPAVRLSAFTELSKEQEPRLLARLDAALASEKAAWLRRWSAARGAAVQEQVRKIGRPRLDTQRAEAFRRFQRDDHEGMQPIVEEMWKAAYLDGSKADLAEPVEAARARIFEYQDWLDQRGRPEDVASRLAGAACTMDEQAQILLCPGRDQGILRDNLALKGRIRPAEYEVILRTNLYRVLMGRNALRIDVKLCEAAREHSTDMKKHDFFSHDSPLKGKRTPQDRAARHKTDCRAENIAIAGTASAAFWGWFHSMGHHRNMMGEWSKIGVGNCEDRWTENF